MVIRMSEERSSSAFAKLSKELDVALTNDEITEDFLLAVKESIKEFQQLKEESKKYPEMIPSLKLYSATSSGETVLQQCISELERGKETGENPSTLIDLAGLISEVSDLGEELHTALDNYEVNRRLMSIRKRTFRVQEEAEEKNLIEDIDTRLGRVSDAIRKAFVKHSSLELESS
jgi:hypothetical protein